jgi:hypothetical protein
MTASTICRSVALGKKTLPIIFMSDGHGSEMYHDRVSDEPFDFMLLLRSHLLVVKQTANLI